MNQGAEPPRAGTYETLLELGRGGMGTIHLARAHGAGGFERLVVVKRMHAHLMVQPAATQRFLDEARVAAQVHHANVVGIHHVGVDETGYFLVLDYVEGDSLEGLIDRSMLTRKPLPVPVVLRLMLDTLAGLHAVHESRSPDGRALNILHRDVSIQNILVGRDGVARLTDFGIAKSALASVSTDARYLVGKLLYSPPEYLQHRRADRRMDIYATGLCMWIALTGGEPWPDYDEGQMVRAILDEGVPRLGQLSEIPAPIEAIVERACCRDPDARYSSADEMLQAIEELGRHTGWVASHTEVAAWMDQLAGNDLVRRRHAISAACARMAKDLSNQAASHSAVRGAGRFPLSIAVGIAGIALLVLLVGLGLRFVPQRHTPAGATSSERDSPLHAQSAPVLPDASAGVPPSLPTPAAREIPSVGASGGRPQPPPAATRARPPRPGTPGDITTANPYR